MNEFHLIAWQPNYKKTVGKTYRATQGELISTASQLNKKNMLLLASQKSLTEMLKI